MSKFLIKASAPLIQATRLEWAAQLAKINGAGMKIMPTGYDRYLDWCDGIIAGTIHAPSAIVYAHKRPGETHACALLAVMHAHPHSHRSTLKLLDLCLEPALDSDNDAPGTIDEKRLEGVTLLVNRSMAACFKMSYVEHRAKVYKTYGRFDEMQMMFPLLKKHLEPVLAKRNVVMRLQGAWLVFEKK